MFSSKDKNSSEKVVVANSVLSRGVLLEESSWRVSLVKSPGEQDHTFLLLEGIKDGVPIHLRSDYFMDLAARAEVAAKIPSFVQSAIEFLTGRGAEDFIGRGFVRTKDLTPAEFKHTLGDCQYQSFPISPVQADELLERLMSEAKKPVGEYSYSIAPGNDLSRASSASSSGIQVHNCLSWCRDTLKTVDIHVGSKWHPAEYPSQVVRQAIKDNTPLPATPQGYASAISQNRYKTSPDKAEIPTGDKNTELADTCSSIDWGT